MRCLLLNCSSLGGSPPVLTGEREKGVCKVIYSDSVWLGFSYKCPARLLHSAYQHHPNLWKIHENQLDTPHKARVTGSFQFSFVSYLTKIPYGLFCITRFLAWFPFGMKRMQSCCLPICHVLLRNCIINGYPSVRSNRRDSNVQSTWEVSHWLVWPKSPKLVCSLDEEQKQELSSYHFDLMVGWWQPMNWQVNEHAWSREPITASAAFYLVNSQGIRE